MADDTDVLLTFCNQHWEEQRHTENQRATLTNLIILIASAIIGLVVQQGLRKDFFPLAILLMLLGIYGALTTLKLYERWRFIQTRLNYWYKQLNKLHPAAEFLSLRDSADSQHTTEFPHLVKLRVHRLWLTLHIAIVLFGVTLGILIGVHPKNETTS